MYIPFGFEENIGSCITAVGGDTTGTFVSGGITYKYHQFSQAGTSSFQVLNGSVSNANILLIAAGGAGGSSSVANTTFGGGGGAGEVFYTSSVSLTSGSVYTIRVGNGEINNGTRGQDSVLNGPGLTNITVLGGGFGGQATSTAGKNGGSGGGGHDGGGGGSHIGSYIGKNGEAGYTIGLGNYGGGGGGAGQNGGVKGQGRGGDGLEFNMTGDSRYYAGGARGSITSGSSVNSDGAGQEWFGGGGRAGTGAAGPPNQFAGGRGKNGCCIITYPYTINCQSQNIPVDIVRSGLIIYNTTSSFSGSVWYDVSGNGNDAIVSGSTMSTSGSLGWEFNGTDNFITYPQPVLLNSSSFAPSEFYTLQWYGSMYNDNINRFLFTKRSAGGGWSTGWASNEDDMVYLAAGSGDPKLMSNIGNVSPKILWTLIVYDAPNILNETAVLYRNESYFGTFDGGGTVTFNNVTSSVLKFGYNNIDVDATYFKGAISDLLVYNRPLSEVEIANNYLYLSS